MKILFISPWFPYPLINGSKQRIFHLLNALSANHEIHLLSFVRDEERIDPQGLQGICQSIETVPFIEFNPRRLKAFIGYFSPFPRSVLDTFSKKMNDRIEEIQHVIKPDVIVFSQISTALYASASTRIPTILEELELGLIHQNWSMQNSLLFRLRRRGNWAKIGWLIKSLMRNSTACTVVSENERRLLRSFASDRIPIQVVPNGIDVGYYYEIPVQPKPNSLIFNGSLTFDANYDAMRFFLSEIFPKVQEKVSDVTLTITGSTQGVELTGLNRNEQVTFTGYLDDIRPAVSSAWVCVVPLRLGGGTRLKILESMASGTPVLTTSKGAEGLDVTPGKDILVADTPGEFVDKMVNLLGDPELRARLSVNGRRLVVEKYSWDQIGLIFTRLVEETAGDRKSEDNKSKITLPH